MSGCKYFSYEYQRGGEGKHVCFLKDSYTEEQLKNGCFEYIRWNFDDPSIHGIAGPASCEGNDTFFHPKNDLKFC